MKEIKLKKVVSRSRRLEVIIIFIVQTTTTITIS
jgi:hypothetical protein